jgi:small subunit ribosomal protein S4
MARFTEPKGKIVRRFGVNIYGNPKFDRLLGKKPNGPGVHGASRRRKVSEYGLQLIEKQKIKYCYGMGERQFRVLFKRALKRPGITGDNLMVLLESRFDNTVYRMGMAPTRDAARQLIAHGHLKIDGRRVNIASYSLRPGEEISVKDSSRSRALVSRYLEECANRDAAAWVAVDRDNLTGIFERTPIREEIPTVANEQLVVELYSK